MRNMANIPQEDRLLYLKIEELKSRFSKGRSDDACMAALAYHALYYTALYDVSLYQSIFIGTEYKFTLGFMHSVMGHQYNLKLQ